MPETSQADRVTHPSPPVETAPRGLSETIRFLAQWARNPAKVGAVMPSSARLAQAMAAAANPHPGKPILELGPGTGPITEALLAAGARQQDLTLVELNPALAALLRKKYPDATVLESDALQIIVDMGRPNGPGAGRTIVSSLPLLSLGREFRAAFSRQALQAIGESGKLIQFTYGRQSPVLTDSLSQPPRQTRVLLNIPPATVWTYQIRA